MPENNYDMFKLVEEVDKQKKSANVNIDDIFSSLDAVKTEEVKTEEEIAFDNLSDGLQQTMRGETMEENVDIMEDAIEKIEEVVDLLDEIE